MGPGDLVSGILERAFPGNLSDGSSYKGIGTPDVDRLAAEFEQPGWMVEQAALKNNILPQRYIRNRNTFSREDQIRLLGSTAVVVGLGGLGGTLVEVLARGGVGTLRLVDGDRFAESNLNRQLFSVQTNIGTSKAESALDRVQQINPSISVTVEDTFLDGKNAARLIQGADVVVDCLDSLNARFTLEAAAQTQGIPMVSAAVAGEIGHVTTVYPEDTGLAGVHGDPEKAGDKGVERSLGSPPHGVSVISALESAEVLKVLLDRDGILKNRLLIVELSNYTFEIVQLG